MDRPIDRKIHSWISQLTGWLSPATFHLACMDWLLHLAISPEEQLENFEKAKEKFLRFILYTLKYTSDNHCEECVHPRPQDHRFQSDAWKEFPFNFYSQAFLLIEELWNESTSNLWGTSAQNQYIVNFTGRQILDMFGPPNLPWTNPEVLSTTVQQRGQNLIRGFNNFLEDFYRYHTGQLPVGTEKFKVGVNVAVTKGQVVYRNRLIELIQYQPVTKKVYAEPILIIPAWIMKYYILDLSPNNSMVKYLLEKGHTVFMISWKNPTSEDGDLDLEDYVNLGIMDALKAINQIVPEKKIHTVGYCIGGTLLSIAAAAMAGKSDDRLQSITLFAAQLDFKDAGEILLFVNASQVSFLEDVMSIPGYLDGSKMAGAFSMLRSTDLIWSRMIRSYLLGERDELNDLMAWDEDTTRLPYKMHSQYLRSLFLNNDLVEGRFNLWDKTVQLMDIKSPLFVVSTLTDHVAPWQSVYKIHFFTDTEITFVLTSGGHNAGIVSEPGHPHRSYQILTHAENHKHIAPEVWQVRAPRSEGSWWPEWQKWLAAHSGEQVSPPSIGNSKQGYDILCDAPGTYVFG